MFDQDTTCFGVGGSADLATDSNNNSTHNQYVKTAIQMA